MSSERRGAEIELDSYSEPPLSSANTIAELEGNGNVSDDNAEFSLPPTDVGKDAWLFLLACFMLEGLIWGSYSDKSITVSNANYWQDSEHRMVYSKNTTVHMSPSQGRAISPLWAHARW